MSVPKGKRNQGDLQVFNCIKILTCYTIHAVGNEKIFPKKTRWLLANRIATECMNASVNIKKANAFHLDETYAPMRASLQHEARANLEAMLGILEIAYETYGLETAKVQHWTKLIIDTLTTLGAWMKSDKERLS